jgi:hypothetical protein
VYRFKECVESVLRAALAIVFCLSVSAHAQTSGFTYQGRLSDSGNPANGSFDLQFRLFDTPGPGTGIQQGPTLVVNPVVVSAGIFTVILDFTVDVFTGAGRYLEIGVRPAGTANAYAVLAPRQQVTSAPYAIETLNTAQLGGLPASRYVATDAAGNVGVGASPDPATRRRVVSEASQSPPRAVSVGTTDNFAAGWDFYHGATGKGYVGSPDSGASFGANELILFGAPGTSTSIWGGSTRGITVGTSGRVGIGALPDGFSQLRVVAGSVPGISSFSTSSRGVFGQSSTGDGVVGYADNGRGVYGDSLTGAGVYGITGGASLTAGGVYGRSVGNGGIGVIGEANTGAATGVFGVSGSGAGFGLYGRNLSGGRALYAEGNAGQDRGSGGIVKAMALINQNGTVGRCYNGVTNAYSGGCGFSVGRPAAGYYDINFGFQVDDRFVSVTPLSNGDQGGCIGGEAIINVLTGVVARIITTCGSFLDKPFMIFVY